MSESVDTSSSAGESIPSLTGALSSELCTLTSGATTSSESTSSRKPHPSDTSFGLSTLAGDEENLENFVKLRPDDIEYLAAAREFFRKEPVFRKKFKVWMRKVRNGEESEKEFWKMIRATRRLQISYRSRGGYTQLRKELVRRLPRNKAVMSLANAMSDLSVNRDE